MRLRLKQPLLFTTLATAVLCTTAQTAGFNYLPAGFDRLFVFTANGEFDPTQSNPDVPDCSDLVCDGNFFQEQIQGRTPEEVDALEEQVKPFFLERFGIDVDDPANIGRIIFFRSYLDPRVDFRAQVITGVFVPRSGFVVRDGAWVVAIIDPNGYELGGEFTGVTVPAGSSTFIGEYNILTIRHRRIVREIDISYRANQFIVPDVRGNSPFFNDARMGRLDETHLFDLSVPATGRAQGIVGGPAFTPEGLFKANLRTVLTFSDQGGL